MCPIHSGQKFKHCCGNSSDSTQDFYAAFHEIGHAWVLPARTRPHVSFKNPCDLCLGDEGQQISRAHTGYNPGPGLTPVEEILYSLAGGAIEEACGLLPRHERFSHGSFPASMGNDLENLEDELPPEIWDALQPHLNSCFKLLVSHFQSETDEIKSVALEFLTARALTSEQLQRVLTDRAKLLNEVAEVLGIQDPPENVVG
jgi:hypothetical protein